MAWRGVAARWGQHEPNQSRSVFGSVQIDGLAARAMRLIEVDQHFGEYGGDPIGLLLGADFLDHFVLLRDGPAGQFQLCDQKRDLQI